MSYSNRPGPARHLGRFFLLIEIRAMVAEMDEEKDATIDYSEIKADPLPEVRF